MGAEERNRILSMLEAGTITAEQAAVLLEAIGSDAPRDAGRAPSTSTAAGPVKPRPPAQLLRIVVDAVDPHGSDNVKVNVNVPLKLARFAANFMPQEARAELKDQGIDLTELIASLGDEMPDGPLVDIDAIENDGEKTVKIRVEVV